MAELALTVFCRPFLHEPLQLLLGMLRDFFNSGGNGGRLFFGESGFENLAQISILVPFSAFGHAKKGLFGADCPVETVLDLHLSEKHHVHCVQGERRFEPGAALGQSLRQIFLQIIDMVLVLDHRILQFKDLPADFLFPGFSYQAAVKDAAAGLGFDNVDAALIDGKDVDFIKISVFFGHDDIVEHPAEDLAVGQALLRRHRGDIFAVKPPVFFDLAGPDAGILPPGGLREFQVVFQPGKIENHRRQKNHINQAEGNHVEV